uniref:CRAL-TRIO domain-containing protein n=1 Tax=Timema genevievae TaxID=629358 RepID=A0A7R9K2B0_TIMGE|nr:unnamed protein product [Timema genevievae]
MGKTGLLVQSPCELMGETGLVAQSPCELMGETGLVAQSTCELMGEIGLVAQSTCELMGEIGLVAQSPCELMGETGLVAQSPCELMGEAGLVAQSTCELMGKTGLVAQSPSQSTCELVGEIGLVAQSTCELMGEIGLVAQSTCELMGEIGLVAQSTCELMGEIGLVAQFPYELMGKLVSWPNNQSGLNGPRNDFFLLRFLRAKQFDVGAALVLLRNYEGWRKSHGQSWLTIDKSVIQQVLQSGVIQILPEKDDQGRRLFWLRVGLWKPRDISADTLLQVGALCGELALLDSGTQINGAVAVFDMRGLGLQQLKVVTPAFARKMVHYLADCISLKINAVHVMNDSVLFAMIFAIFKKFLDDSMKKRSWEVSSPPKMEPNSSPSYPAMP